MEPCREAPYRDRPEVIHVQPSSQPWTYHRTHRPDKLGTITRGKLADVIVVDGNPLLSMRDLRNVGRGREGRERP